VSATKAFVSFLAVWIPTSLAHAIVVDVPPERSRVEAIANALSDETVRGLSGLPPGAVAIRVRTDLPQGAPRADVLIDALLAPTITALSADRRVERSSIAGDGADAMRHAARASFVVLVDHHVRVVGHSLRIDVTIWRAEGTAASARFDLRSRLDPEVRSYTGPILRLTEGSVVARSAALPGRGYVALAIHDLDGDGANELVAITPRTVQVMRLGPGRAGLRLFMLGESSIPVDIGRAPAPTRRPLGTTSRAERALFARVSDRAHPFRIELANGIVRVARADDRCPATMFPIDGACVQLQEGRDYFDDVLTFPGAEPATRDLPAFFYARAERRVRTAEGVVIGYEALVTPTGRLSVRAGDRLNSAVGYGTALAMTDLDDDGTMELLTSSTRLAGEGDQLALVRALPRGTLTVVWRSEILPGSVWITAHGDLDGDGLEELFAIEEPRGAQGRARLWIVR
jgi:hypothetical protein